MSIDAFEKREQTLQLHANVLQAEQERIDGAPTLSVSEARKQLKDACLKTSARLFRTTSCWFRVSEHREDHWKKSANMV